MRTLLLAANKGDKKCKLAVDMYIHRIIKYIGTFVSVLNGTDALVFTAGIGERSPEIRKKIMDRLSWLNLTPDDTINEKAITKNPAP